MGIEHAAGAQLNIGHPQEPGIDGHGGVHLGDQGIDHGRLHQGGVHLAAHQHRLLQTRQFEMFEVAGIAIAPHGEKGAERDEPSDGGDEGGVQAAQERPAGLGALGLKENGGRGDDGDGQGGQQFAPLNDIEIE